MIQPRIIPILLLNQDGGLVKTQSFKKPVYIGDPINAVRIFNEKEVDELVLLDIKATINKQTPKFNLISDIVSESFMPVGYGGGINSLDQVKKIFDLGIEKVIINSAMSDLNLIEQAASIFGSQSIVISLDFRKSILGKYYIYTNSGTQKLNIDYFDQINKLINAGAGELIVQSIEHEGTMKGYDLKLIKNISTAVDIPVVASGGAGCLLDFNRAIVLGKASAAAAGSLFVYKGIQKGILINYPSQNSINKLFNE